MGSEQSILKKHGYIFERKTENGVVATKEGDTFLIREINVSKIPRNTVAELKAEIEILKTTSHPYLVSSKNSFQDGTTYYIVMDYCQGGSLAEEIKQKRESGGEFEEYQILNWLVQICMAMKYIHDKCLLHKDLMPKAIFLTEFGTVRLGGFGKVGENSTSPSTTNSNPLEKGAISYLAPETLTDGMYKSKSDIWSVGCVLYELCTLTLAFSAETTIKLNPKILGGPYPALPERYSPELCQLLSDIFSRDLHARPTAKEILGRPFVISFLSKKSKATVKELQTNLDRLRAVADGLERVHQGTTIGSLTGGVIGAVGGITSIVGLILTPFTLGASLIVTGVGIGVAAAGGVTAGVSNITKMVNQSSDRKAIRSIIKEFDEKISAVVVWLQEITEGLENIRMRCESADFQDSSFSQENLAKLGIRAGRGVGGISELVRLVQVMNIGRVAAQTARAVRVAEVATGVLAGLFVAADIFFIAMDAKEIHHIRQAKAKSNPQADPIRSEIMRFVRSIRETAGNLQEVLDEMKGILSVIPSLEY
ncbi:serine/threonine-protein kinase Nek4-like isoform X2 [Centroberyx gerrardi]